MILKLSSEDITSENEEDDDDDEDNPADMAQQVGKMLANLMISRRE